MSRSVEARLDKVKRTSRSARRICYLLMVLVALAALVGIAATLTIPETLTCDLGGVRQPCRDLPPGAIVLTTVALVGGLALMWAALYRLARLFGNYSRGEIFTRGSVGEIRWLGYVAVAYAVFQVALFVATLAVFAGAAAEVQTNLRFELPLGPVVIASFLLLLSWVMDVGAEMREENELTV
jgi:hypothetical protein